MLTDADVHARLDGSDAVRAARRGVLDACQRTLPAAS
jgi:hypothetical protein